MRLRRRSTTTLEQHRELGGLMKALVNLACHVSIQQPGTSRPPQALQRLDAALSEARCEMEDVMFATHAAKLLDEEEPFSVYYGPARKEETK